MRALLLLLALWATQDQPPRWQLAGAFVRRDSATVRRLLAPDVMIRLIEGEAVEDPVFTGLDECTKDTADTCIQR